MTQSIVTRRTQFQSARQLIPIQRRATMSTTTTPAKNGSEASSSLQRKKRRLSQGAEEKNRLVWVNCLMANSRADIKTKHF